MEGKERSSGSKSRRQWPHEPWARQGGSKEGSKIQDESKDCD